jgi:CheY-specific phosphatase CheX
MVPERVHEKLQKAVQKTLEEVAFIFTEPCENPEPISGQCVEATIAFFGKVPGRLVFRAPRHFAELLAANILGLEPEDATAGALAHEAVGELLNMVGGILLESWFGVFERYHLGIPKVKETQRNETHKEDRKNTYTVALTTEEEDRLEITAYFE